MAKPYYFGSIRNIVAAFGQLFADIHIEKEYEGGEIHDIRVPLHYGPRHAWYEKLKEKLRDDEQAAKISRTLPRISYEMGNLAYANDRKTTTVNRHVHRENGIKSRIYHQYAPIPYDFDFKVSIAVKNIEDGLRIMEQIIPLFRPDHTITINELPALNIKEDITVNMKGITNSDEYEGQVSGTHRVITWDLMFTIHGHIFPPIRDAKLITDVTAAVNDYKSKIVEDVRATATMQPDGSWKEEVNIQVPKS